MNMENSFEFETLDVIKDMIGKGTAAKYMCLLASKENELSARESGYVLHYYMYKTYLLKDPVLMLLEMLNTGFSNDYIRRACSGINCWSCNFKNPIVINKLLLRDKFLDDLRIFNNEIL
ncbi:hypothetical protein [Anaerovibrio sp.]|uniref:hypothetical protein n=1 Tax=Anaerovibrio sp. TaxID=1872532 RepID=UPI003890DF76